MAWITNSAQVFILLQGLSLQVQRGHTVTYNYNKHLVEGEEYTERPNNKTKIIGIFRKHGPRREVGLQKMHPKKIREAGQAQEHPQPSQNC